MAMAASIPAIALAPSPAACAAKARASAAWIRMICCANGCRSGCLTSSAIVSDAAFAVPTQLPEERHRRVQREVRCRELLLHERAQLGSFHVRVHAREVLG